jgi:hypothetical protein
MFATDDPMCPPLTFTLVFSDANPASATEPTDDELTNVFVEEESGTIRVRYFATDPGTFTYWIQAETVGGVYVNKPGQLINNCGSISQDIWLTTDGDYAESFARNLGTQEIWTDSELLDLFTQVDSTRCAINKLEIFDEQGGSLLTSGDAFDALSLETRASNMAGLGVETNVTILAAGGITWKYTYDFAIKATAEGGAVEWKTASIVVLVCDGEVITLVEDVTLEKTIVVASDAEVDTTDLTALFESDDSDYCPVSSYTIVMGNDYANQVGPTDDEALNFYISGTDLNLFPDTTGTYSFFVLAESPSGEHIYKEVTLSVSCDGSSVSIDLATDGTLIINALKNQDGDVIELLTEAEAQALFSVTSDQCPIETYTLLTAAGDAIEDDTDLFAALALAARVGDEISIDTSVTLDDTLDGTVVSLDSTFMIRAAAAGGFSADQNVTIKVIVCGWEDLTLVTDQKAVYSYAPADETDDYSVDITVHF